MTIQELIDLLQAVTDKETRIVVETGSSEENSMDHFYYDLLSSMLMLTTNTGKVYALTTEYLGDD